MIISRWLSRTDQTSRFTQPDRRPARRFTPCADGLEDRISLSSVTLNGGNTDFRFNGTQDATATYTNTTSGGVGGQANGVIAIGVDNSGP